MREAYDKLGQQVRLGDRVTVQYTSKTVDYIVGAISDNPHWFCPLLGLMSEGTTRITKEIQADWIMRI